MNAATIDKVAKALLYEGYILYPYRPSSVKNRQRFNFGVLYPRSYSEQQDGYDPWFFQTECLLAGSASSAIEIRVRFLQLMEQSVRGRSAAPEAIEREIVLPTGSLDALIDQPLAWNATFEGNETPSPGSNNQENVDGTVLNDPQPVQALVALSARPASEGLFKITVQVKNGATPTITPNTRDEALMHSLVSAHAILGVQDGEFVSLLDPPEPLKTFAEECKNIGVFPVLAGDRSRRDLMLSSPIILYDYPEVAPESAGDLFDATEIDEILSLRIMTLTDAEKDEVRNSGDRARSILERTENLPEEQLMKLHGVMRGLPPLGEESSR